MKKSSGFTFKDWQIDSSHGHILSSKGEQRDRYEKDINLPHLP